MKKLLLSIVLIVGCERWQYIDKDTKHDNWFGDTYHRRIDVDAMEKKYQDIVRIAKMNLDSSILPEDVKNDLNKFLESNPKYSNYSDYQLYKYLKTLSYSWVKGNWKEADNYESAQELIYYVAMNFESMQPDSMIYKWVKIDSL